MSRMRWMNRRHTMSIAGLPRKPEKVGNDMLDTFEGWFCARVESMQAVVWEGVARGYWTLSAKRSSGLISHYGSTPLPSFISLDLKI